MGDQPGDRKKSRMTCKSYDIPKTLIWEAWLHVKANQGAGDRRGDDRAIRDEARSEPVQALEIG